MADWDFGATHFLVFRILSSNKLQRRSRNEMSDTLYWNLLVGENPKFSEFYINFLYSGFGSLIDIKTLDFSSWFSLSIVYLDFPFMERISKLKTNFSNNFARKNSTYSPKIFWDNNIAVNGLWTKYRNLMRKN